MADRGHELTEQIIKRTERRLRREYEQAAKEVKEKLDDYLKRFEAKDKKWREWVAKGKKTKEEYAAWRRGQIIVGKRWAELKENLSSDMLHTNEIAKDIINGMKPQVYALNHAYGTWQVEHSGGLDTSYTLYNREAVERIFKENPNMLPPPGKKVAEKIARGEAKRWAKESLQSVAVQSILQGDSIPEMARRLAEKVEDTDYKAAVRNARTMATGAQNAGRYNAYRRARDMGIDLVIEWAAILDNRTRHAHREMHGQRTTVDEPFYTPDGFTIMWPADTTSSVSTAPQSEIWNCFVGDTNVTTDSEILRSYKHEYTGELITIETATGVKFTCTPNHPIMTPTGWVPVALLNKGDDLLIASVGDGAGFFRDCNVDHVHPTFHALHDSLHDLGRVEEVSMADFNFHGDIPTSNVEVVSKKGKLRGCFNPGFVKSGDEIRFKDSDAFCFGKSHFVSSLRRVYISAFRFMCSRCKALTFFLRGVCHTNVHGFRSVSRSDSCVSKNTINDLPRMSNLFSEGLDGLSGNVFADNIVSINRHTGRHVHVYNLQTENGYYYVNNIIEKTGEKNNTGNYAIAHNCRCTLLAWVAGFEMDTVTTSDDVPDFDEWLNGKEESEPIMSQWEKGEAIRMQYINQYRRG